MLPFMEVVCYHLWKWYVTVYGSGMLPLMVIVCYRLWKWYVTAYGNGMLPLCPALVYTVYGSGRQPLIEMADNRFRQPK